MRAMARVRQRRRGKQLVVTRSATGSPVNERFSGFLKSRRKALRLSLREAAQSAEVSNGYLSLLENAKRPPPHPAILKRLARVYRVPLETLFAEAGYLGKEPAVAFTEAEVNQAFDFVLRDPSYRFGTRLYGELDLDVKRFVVEMYEKATGKKLLGHR